MSEAEEGSVHLTPLRRVLILLSVILATTLYGTTLLVVSTILPQMQGSFSATADEIAWRRFYGPFMRLMNDYKNMGGRVTVGSDAGFIYQTWGFSYIQELEMLQEAGFAPLEVIQAATINGARELAEPRGQEPEFGLIRTGMLADLVIVPGNPLSNLKLLYGTGHMRLNPETQQVERL